MTSLCMLALCGAPLASRAASLAMALVDAGWLVQLAATDAASDWLDEAALREVAGHTPKSSYRVTSQPEGEIRPVGQPDVVVVAPMTFNTLNKLATGIADTYVHTQLCLALAQGTPIVAVPMFSENLGHHPVTVGSLRLLREAGVDFVDPCTGSPDVRPFRPGTDDEVVRGFDLSWVVARVEAHRPAAS